MLPLPADLTEDVGAAMQETARALILPNFRKLAAGDVSRKGAHSLVTRIDHECEARLTTILSRLLPGAQVIGEEAVAADPALLSQLAGGRLPETWTWLLDPLDGTANFVAGREPFAVMVALLQDGEPRLGWILTRLPTGCMWPTSQMPGSPMP